MSASNDDSVAGATQKPHYLSYLKILELIQLRDPLSKTPEKPEGEHEEHLFILIHQVYELWFKQILHELDSILKILAAETVKPSRMFLVNSRARRIIVIQKILVEQIKVLETMTPLDFLDFRHCLAQSSGFESHQFRLIETKLGLQKQLRRAEGSWESILSKFKHYPKQAKELDEAAKQPSLLDLVDRWLAGMPGIDGEFQFLQKYCEAVEKNVLEPLKKDIESETDPETRDHRWRKYKNQNAMFQQLIDKTKHEELQKQGRRRLSHKAIQGALLISLYREEPRFQPAYQFISLLTEIDNLLMHWRHNHSLFVHRMIGDKMGTGGSPGYRYLHDTIREDYRIFLDFFNLSSYMIPRWHAPKLSQEMKDKLAVHFTDPEEERRFAERRLAATKENE